MLKKYQDKGTEPWEVYAWVVREILAEAGKCKKSDCPLSDKLKYTTFMQMKENEI